jgi:hypothetical protein
LPTRIISRFVRRCRSYNEEISNQTWKTLQGEPQFTPYTTQIGEYNYADTIDYEGGFRMTGQITVVADQQNNIADTTTNNTADTLGLLMVPAEDSQDIAQTLGDQQTLLVWITNGKAMNEIISTLQQISEELPYG